LKLKRQQEKEDHLRDSLAASNEIGVFYTLLS
jgi:hypothetical protein